MSRFCTCLLVCVWVGATGCDLSDTVPEPAFKLSAPQSGSQTPGLWRPKGVWVGASGEVYVAEAGAGRVRALEGGVARVIQDTTSAEGWPWSRPSATWGQGLLEIDGALLLLTPGQPPVLLSTDEGGPQTLGLSQGGKTPEVGARLGDLNLSGVSGIVPLEGQSLLVALDNRIWLAQRNGGALQDATLTRPLAGNGARAQGPDDAPDATQIPLDLSTWCGLEAHPSGGFFFAEGKDRFRLVTPGGRALVLTGQGDLRHARPEGLDFSEFGARFDSQTIARWHPTEGVLYFADNLWVMRLRLDSSMADLDSPGAQTPTGRVIYAASRLPESSDFVLLGDKALFSAGYSGSLWTVSLDGLDIRETFYGPNPVDEALGQLNADRYNLNPEEPYASRHKPFVMEAPLLPQALALWGDNGLVVGSPLARALQTLDTTQAQWAAREFLYDAKTYSLGWPFLAQDLARPERLYVSDLNTLQAWALTGDGLAALGVLSFTAPPLNGIPGPGLDAILAQRAQIDANAARVALLNPDGSLAALEFKNQQLSIPWSQGLGVLPQGGTRSIFAWDLTGAAAWDTSKGGDQYAFALPVPSSWEGSSGQFLALAHAGASLASPVKVGGVEVDVKLAAHIAGGGSVSVAAGLPPEGVPALDAFLRQVTALDVLELASGADTTSQGLLFAVPDESEDGAGARLLFLGDTPTVHEILSPCGGSQVPAVAWVKALSVGAQPAALLAWNPDDATLWGCASEPGWSIGGTTLGGQWSAIRDTTGRFPPAFAPDAGAVVLVSDTDDEVLVLAVAGPQKPSLFLESLSYEAPFAADWTAITTPPDASLLVAQAVDPASQEITLQAARLRDGSSLASVQAVLPETTRIAGGGQGIGDGGVVSALTPGRRLAGLTVAPDGGLYMAVGDTQTLWYLPTKRLDDPAAVDRAKLLAVKGPLFEDSGNIYPLAANDLGVFVGAGTKIYFVDRQTKEVLLVAGGGEKPPSEHLDAKAASLGAVQGLAAMNDNIYAITTRELIEVRPDGTLGVLSQDGALLLADGSTLQLGFEVFGGSPLVPWPPSSLLMASPHTHGIVHIPTPAVRLQ